MYCTNCGKELSEVNKFCTNCGIAVQAQPVEQQKKEAPKPVEVKEEKPKVEEIATTFKAPQHKEETPWEVILENIKNSKHYINIILFSVLGLVFVIIIFAIFNSSGSKCKKFLDYVAADDDVSAQQYWNENIVENEKALEKVKKKLKVRVDKIVDDFYGEKITYEEANKQLSNYNYYFPFELKHAFSEVESLNLSHTNMQIAEEYYEIGDWQQASYYYDLVIKRDDNYELAQIKKARCDEMITNSEISNDVNNGSSDSSDNYSSEEIFGVEGIITYTVCGVYPKLNANSEEYFWIETYGPLGGKVPVIVDDELNIIKDFDNSSITPISGIYSGISAIYDENTDENTIINISGEDISYIYANQNDNERIVGLFKDSTGITVWTLKEIDTFNKSLSILYAKDINGNIKQQWESDKIYQIGESYVDGIAYFGNATYHISGVGDCFLNVENGNDTSNGESFILSRNSLCSIADNGNIYVSVDGGNYVSFRIYSDLGEEIFSKALYGLETYKHYGKYSNGLVYMKGKSYSDNKEYNGFFNKEGECVINLAVDVDNKPYFNGEYALIEIVNNGGSHFVTLIDRSGNMLFEPIKGKDAANSGWNSVDEKINNAPFPYIIDCDGYYKALNRDGTTKYISSEMLDGFEKNGIVYYVSNGEICTEQL